MKATGLTKLHFTVFLVSAIIMIGEITLMRDLALRFWNHLAWLAVSIALLGFGASGTMLILLRRFCRLREDTLLFVSLLACGISFPGSLRLADTVNIDLMQMVWQPASMLSLSLMELTLTMPFLCGGLCIAQILTANVSSTCSLYGASCAGSGLGALVAPLLLYLFGARELMELGAILLIGNALLFAKNSRRFTIGLALAVCAGITAVLLPQQPAISSDKDLPQLLAMPGTKSLLRAQGPQGVLEVLYAPAFHAAPGLALLSQASLPPQQLITLDGHIAGTLYLADARQDFRFMDDATVALAFNMQPHQAVLILDPAGNGLIGLAQLHAAEIIDVVTPNELVGDFLRSHVTAATKPSSVQLYFTTCRAYLQQTAQQYALIVLPATGSDFAGLQATEPDHVLTLETIGLGLNKLSQNGMLAVTTEAHLPPRESLRLVNLLAQSLQLSGRPAASHLVVVRNWATVTILASSHPLTPDQLEKIYQFCHAKGFDLLWPGDRLGTGVKRHHRVPGDPYLRGVTALLSNESTTFSAGYIYDLATPTDDKPFFHAFWKWLPAVNTGQEGAPLGNSRSFRELGTVLLLAALAQSIVLAFALIILPLLPTIGLPTGKPTKGSLLFFFAAIGFGYMLIEVGVMQRLTTYLAHPVWAAATVLSAFLLFSGLGSTLATRIGTVPSGTHLKHLMTIGGVIGLSALLIVGMDKLLIISDHLPFFLKITLVYVGLAPLATAMGMVFPIGMQRVGARVPEIIPWAWSINGFASVIAALAAPLLAMGCGFRLLLWTAVLCYLVAGICCRKMVAPASKSAQEA